MKLTTACNENVAWTYCPQGGARVCDPQRVHTVLAGMFYKHCHSERVLFINTLLQRGLGAWWKGPNRFSGFRQRGESVETVLRLRYAQNTPLKQGVNDKMQSDYHLMSGLRIPVLRLL